MLTDAKLREAERACDAASLYGDRVSLPVADVRAMVEELREFRRRAFDKAKAESHARYSETFKRLAR